MEIKLLVDYIENDRVPTRRTADSKDDSNKDSFRSFDKDQNRYDNNRDNSRNNTRNNTNIGNRFEDGVNRQEKDENIVSFKA